MIRSILGVIAGIFCGGLAVFLLELPGMFLYPLPPGFDWQDQEALKAHFVNAPTALKAVVLFAWAVGPLVGAFLACWIARRAFLLHGMIVGVVFVLLDLMNLVGFPHPVSMWIGGLLAPLVTSWLGAHLAQRFVEPRGSGPRPYDMRDKNMAC